jgi:Family of unknown function (DUF6510)
MIDDDQTDMNTALMLDGNAIAGQLLEIFGRDMTTAITKCAGCASDAAMGALMAFTQSPGLVLRCPVCQAVVARIVETPAAIYLDARGAVYVQLTRNQLLLKE